MSNIEQRELSQLKKHLVNTDIYGDEVNAEFVASIKNLGVLVPLTVLPDGTVISGHRRMQAARIAKLKTVPVIVRTDLTDPDEIERALIESNRQREKSNETKAREAQRLLAIEQRAAEKRQQATQAAKGEKIGSKVVAPVPPPTKLGDSSNFGKTRDAVGKAVGLGAKSVDAAVKVVEKIDQAKAAGDTKTAEHLTETLNKKGIRTALREMRQAEQAEQPQPTEKTEQPGPEDSPAVVSDEPPPQPDLIAGVQQAISLEIEFDTYTRSIRKWFRDVKGLAGKPGSIFLDDNKLEEIKFKLENVVIAFTSAKPHALCPYCLGTGCKVCRECGYVTESTFHNAPEAKRVEALKRKAVRSR